MNRCNTTIIKKGRGDTGDITSREMKYIQRLDV